MDRQNRRRIGYPQKIQHQYYGNQGERKINMAVSPETVLTDNITLLVLGAYKELQKCFRI